MTGWGGSRPGSGRPRGSRNRYLRDEPGYQQTILQAEELRHGKAGPKGRRRRFRGDALDLLVDIYSDLRLPLNIRQNAAIAAAPFERPRMSDSRVLLLEQRASDATTAERQRLDAEGDQRLAELIAQWELFTADRSAEIQSMLAAGEITEAAASKIRLWHLPELPLLPAPEEPQGSPHASKTPEPSGSLSSDSTLSSMPSMTEREPANRRTSPLPAIGAEPASEQPASMWNEDGTAEFGDTSRWEPPFQGVADGRVHLNRPPSPAAAAE